ncbi:MAG: hypothetical protein JXQ75_04710, partial [Phycisphaerae bacterium]|nr:hypothetical protein [Phycisphaerae bacterium]
SRRAYEFLLRIDLDSETPCGGTDSDQPDQARKEDIRLVGLKAFWTSLLLQLARESTSDEHERMYASIRSTSQTIERQLAAHKVEASKLTAQSQTIRTWLAYFCQRPNFDAYVAAVARARSAFDLTLRHAGRFQPPALVEFRPIAGLFQARDHAEGTKIALPTPMISFSECEFGRLGRATCEGAGRQAVLAATWGDAYQGIQAELDALCGAEEEPIGVHRDLFAAFERVNGRYFEGTLSHPRLTWSRTFTGWKFGHYDLIRDTVMISCSLDPAEVPEYVLDYVMHHELLHKKLGVDWSRRRAVAHTTEFRQQERRFDRYADADVFLNEFDADAPR